MTQSSSFGASWQPPQALHCSRRNADAVPLARIARATCACGPRIDKTLGGKDVPVARLQGPTKVSRHRSTPICSLCETIQEVTNASISARTNSLSGVGSDARTVAPMLLREFPLNLDGTDPYNRRQSVANATESHHQRHPSIAFRNGTGAVMGARP